MNLLTTVPRHANSPEGMYVPLQRGHCDLLVRDDIKPFFSISVYASYFSLSSYVSSLRIIIILIHRRRCRRHSHCHLTIRKGASRLISRFYIDASQLNKMLCFK